MLIALILVLMILWALGFLQIVNVDFLRVAIANVGGRAVTILDALIGLSIVMVAVALRGPLGIAVGVLLVLWGLSVVGIVVVEGIPLNALLVLVLIVGLVVHVLIRRPA
jgi:hypothetical protein